MLEQSKSRIRASIRIGFLLSGIIFVTVASIGWLYWLRIFVAQWPGPRLTNALPLDELASHENLPLVVFIVVFGIAAALLGVVMRGAHLDRASAALTLTTGIGGVCFLANAVSLFVVRQVPFDDAIHLALPFQSTYFAATIGGLGGALLGRQPTSRKRFISVLTVYATVICGILDLVSAIDPHARGRHTFFGSIAAGLLPPLSRTLVVPVGLLLVTASRGLARKNRTAWRLAVILLGASSVLHIVRNLDYAAAIVTGLTALLLVIRRHDFSATSDPSAHPRAASRLIAIISAAFIFGLLTRLAHQASINAPILLGSAATGSLRGLIGMGKVVRGSFAWFSWSELSIVMIGVVWAISIWTAPWRQRFIRDEDSRQRAMAIVRAWGGDAIAPFALRRDKEQFFWPSNASPKAFLSYRIVRGVAVVTGDPIGPPQALKPTLLAFEEHAHARGWRLIIVGASETLLGLYQSAGFHTLYHGDEAMIDTASFSLVGGQLKAVRQAAHRVERNGYRASVVPAGEIDSDAREELQAIEMAWLGDRHRTGFVMEFDELFCLDGDDAMFVIGRDQRGAIAGFLHVAVCHPSKTLSLSSMPRRDGTPNGFNAWLIVEAIRWADEHGFAALSLNFSPFAGLLDTNAQLSSLQKVEREALLKVKGVLSLQLDNLHRFNKSFNPRFVSRYVVYERMADLPRVVVAAMAAEGYFPLAERLRSWDDKRDKDASEPEVGLDQHPQKDHSAHVSVPS